VNALPDERAAVYCEFTGRSENEALTNALNDVTTDYPVLDTAVEDELHSLLSPSESNSSNDNNAPSSSITFAPPLYLKPTNPNTSHHAHFGTAVDITRLIPLWFASPALLESFVNVPAKVSNRLGSAVVRLLRAQTGFAEEGDGVAGMDEVVRGEKGQVVGLVELGLEMLSRHRNENGRSSHLPQSLKEVLHDADSENGAKEEVAFAKMMLHASMRPIRYRNVLLGMTAAFVELHEFIASSDLPMGRVLSEEGRAVIAAIAKRERASLAICVEEVGRQDDEDGEQRREREFGKGRSVARRMIDGCFRA